MATFKNGNFYNQKSFSFNLKHHQTVFSGLFYRKKAFLTTEISIFKIRHFGDFCKGVNP